jgi:hypothetical protein
MPLNKSWHEYNESLIERGRILMDIGFLRSSNREIKNMNKGKVGAPFEYSRTYIQFLAFLKNVEVKEGAVHKKRYFIPKYYVQGFDGENIRTSLTKYEIKDRYERDNPPTESEFQTEEYMEHRRKVDSTYPQFIHGIPWMAKEPGVQLQTEQSGETLTIPWEEVIHKRVKTTDNADIGDVELVGNEFIVVRQGEVKIRRYYIPKSYINNYDGSAVYVPYITLPFHTST